MGLFKISSNRKLIIWLLPVAISANQSHKLKKFSRSSTSKIIIQTLNFTSTDFGCTVECLVENANGATDLH